MTKSTQQKMYDTNFIEIRLHLTDQTYLDFPAIFFLTKASATRNFLALS